MNLETPRRDHGLMDTEGGPRFDIGDFVKVTATGEEGQVTWVAGYGGEYVTVRFGFHKAVEFEKHALRKVS